MAATVASVHEAAQALLDTSVAALETTAAGFGGVSWLNPGQPAFDVQCDFVAVWQSALNMYAAPTIPASMIFRTGPRVHLVTLNVTTGRCVATGLGNVPPTTAEKTADAEKVMEDGQALFNGVSNEIANGDLFTLCSQIQIQGMTAYTPQGGMAGWNLVVLVQINGYPVDLS